MDMFMDMCVDTCVDVCMGVSIELVADEKELAYASDCANVHTHVYTHVMHVSIHVPKRISAHISIHMCIPMSAYMPTRMSMHMSIHMYAHVCIHVYTHVHTHVYTHIYTHVYTHISTLMPIHMSYTCSQARLYAHAYAHVYTHDRGLELVADEAELYEIVFSPHETSPCLHACLRKGPYACLCTCLYTCPHTRAQPGILRHCLACCQPRGWTWRGRRRDMRMDKSLGTRPDMRKAGAMRHVLRPAPAATPRWLPAHCPRSERNPAPHGATHPVRHQLARPPIFSRTPVQRTRVQTCPGLGRSRRDGSKEHRTFIPTH